LPLEASVEDLQAALAALQQWLVVMPPRWVVWLVSGPGTALAEGEPPGPLTERERQVLEGLAHGLANKQIATQLGITERMVKAHLSSLYAKLGASNHAQAVRLGLRYGLIGM